MLQHAPLHLVVAEIGDQRLQRPQDIQHIAVLPLRLELQLFSGGLLLEVEQATAHNEMPLRRVFLQHSEACGLRRLVLQLLTMRPLARGGIGVEPRSSHGFPPGCVTLRTYRDRLGARRAGPVVVSNVLCTSLRPSGGFSSVCRPCDSPASARGGGDTRPRLALVLVPLASGAHPGVL